MIILISLIKPHHFIFLIIGILVYEKEFLKYAIISTLIVILIYFLEFTYNNELFLSYLSNLHASTTPEFFFSYNATVGLKSVIQNLPTNIAEQFNFYISAGPNLIKNLLWFFLTFFGRKHSKTNGFFNIFERKHSKTNGFVTFLSDNKVKPMVFQHFWAKTQ